MTVLSKLKNLELLTVTVATLEKFKRFIGLIEE